MRLKVFNLAAIALVSLGLSGCKYTIEKAAEKAENELGIEIDLQTRNDDACIKDQLERLYQDYKTLTQDAQNQLKEDLRQKYSKILLVNTQNTEVITKNGGRVFLFPRSYSYKQNDFIQTTVSEGTAPVTTLTSDYSSDRAQVLTIAMQSSTVIGTYETYSTDSPYTYFAIESLQDAQVAAKYIEHFYDGTTKSTTLNCDFFTLDDLRNVR